MEVFDVIVIGQGYAGLSASKLAAQKGLRVVNLESGLQGGLIVNVNDLDPATSLPEHSGAELASNLAIDNMDAGVAMISEAAISLSCSIDETWQVKTDSNVFMARNVIVASGAVLRKLGVPGEQEFFGQGVSECADCDGPMFKGMQTVIVGGGDSAFQEALALSQFANSVTMVMRGSKPRARPDFLQRAAENPKLTLLMDSKVTAIFGSAHKGVEAVQIETGGRGQHTLAASGVFVFIGLQPNTAFLPENLTRDDAGALVTNDQCATAQPGLWAIGAVRSGFGGLLTDALSDAQRVVSCVR